jgi:hypothetical protein
LDLDIIKTVLNATTEKPALTLSMLAIGATTALTLAKAFHKKSITNKDELISILEAQITAKQHSIEEYQQRLNLDPTKGSTYSRATHKELQTAALSLAEKLKNLTSKLPPMPYVDSMSWRERENPPQNMLDWRSKHTAATQQIIKEYFQHFRSDSVLIRDEIYKRLNIQTDSLDLMLFDTPTNIFGIQHVINKLEENAKNLI